MSNKGFSLVELIVVIAIMAILVGVAVPVYTSYIDKAQETADRQYLSDVVYAAQLFAAENGLELDRIAIAPVVKAEDHSALYATVGSYNTDTPFEYYYSPDTTPETEGSCAEHKWTVKDPVTCTADGWNECENCQATQRVPSEGHKKGAYLFSVGNLDIYACEKTDCEYQIVEPQGGLIGG